MQKMTTEEFKRLVSSPKARQRSKYNAKKTYVDGICFASKREADRYEANKLRIKAGELQFQLLQVPFNLPAPPGKKPKRYLLDFMEVYPDGRIDYVDVKGFETQTFKVKRDIIEAIYGVKIQCVRK